MRGEIDMKHAGKIKFTKCAMICIEAVAAICTIIDFVFKISEKILSVEFEGTFTVQETNMTSQIIFNACLDYFLNNWLLCILNLLCIIYFVKVVLIPFNKVFVKKVEVQNAAPFFSSIVFFGFLLGFLFCYHILVDVGKAQIPPIKIVGEDIPDSHINDVEEEMEEPSLTEKEIVEIYVIRCETEVISMEEWNTLSDSELSHIRNGIFAYVGQLFTSGYYDEYLWYHPKYTSDEAKDHLNSCQWDNVENIKFVENQRL